MLLIATVLKTVGYVLTEASSVIIVLVLKLILNSQGRILFELQ